MEQPGATLNQDPANDGLGVSSSPDAPHFNPDGQNIVSTVEDIDFDDLLEEGADESSEETLKTDETGQEKTSEEDVPFHKHPRWQEVQAEKEQLKTEVAAIKAEMQRLQSGIQAPPTVEQKRPYVDITTMEPEKLQEWQVEDPKGYAANLYAQMRYELFNEAEQKSRNQKKQEGFETDVMAYKKSNPDFEEMLKNGEIGKFLNEHPAHNPISAHQALTAEKKLNEAIESAKKEAREETLKQLRAKKHSQVLGSGPAVSRGPAEENELKDTKQKGGLTSVLAGRLAQMRRKAG